MSFRAAFFLIFVALMLFVPSGLKRLTKGFKLAKMHLDLPNHLEWETGPIDGGTKEELDALFKRPFTYLDRGAQCYVFMSEDGNYVLKLFRYDRGKISSQEKAIRLFRGCHLAYSRAKEETGLLYIHLNPTQGLFPEIQIRSPLGKTYTLPLDEYRFVIQKKAETIGAIFKEAYAKKECDRGRKTLQQLLTLVRARASLQIRNLDPDLGRNFGLIDSRAIEIDFGSYIYTEDPDGERVEIEQFFSRLSRWFSKSFPEWAYLIEEEKNGL